MTEKNTEIQWPAPSETTRIILIRHGETDWNKATRYQGHVDIALNQTGQLQAKALCERLVSLAAQTNQNCLFTHCVSSNLSRAKTTAEIITPACITIELEPRLWERNYGQLAGLTSTEMQAQHPSDFNAIASREPNAPITGGETLIDFYTRVINAFEEIIKKHRRHTLLVVAHGGVLDCIYRYCTQTPLAKTRGWFIPNAALNVIDFFSDNSSKIQIWADTNHTQNLNNQNLDELDGRVT